MLGGHPGRIASPAEAVAGRLVEEGIDIRLTSGRSNALARGAEMARDILALAGHVDRAVVLVYSGRSFAYAALAARLCRRLSLPVVFWLHGGGLPELAARRPRGVRRVLSRGLDWIVPSEYLRRELGATLPRATLIPNLVDADRLAFRPRASLAPRLLWMRSFVAHCRPALAVRTLADLVRSHPQATLTMAGADQGELEPTRRLAERLGVLGRIRFPGFVGADEKPAELDRHDLFLHTNALDNAPISLLEAASCGLPIVGCDVGGVADLLRPGSECLLSRRSLPAELAEAARRLLDEPRLAAELATAARRVAEGSSWRRIRGLWLETLSRPLEPLQAAEGR
jgi:glycosyltransferase involved in cell wall biosynthesis